MENATKALLIAGGVLITIIILSLGVGLYALFSNQSKKYSQIMASTEVQKFNSNFDVYVGREDITAQEIVSVVNLSKSIESKVKIIVSINGRMVKISNSEDFIKENTDKVFKCISVNTLNKNNPSYDDAGRITGLQFTN